MKRHNQKQENYIATLEKLKRLPNCSSNEFYRFADFIELRCLVNQDGIYTKADFVDEAKERVTDLGEGDYSEELDKIEEGEGNAQKNDRWERLSDDYFRNITFRKKLFGAFYPFSISQGRPSLKLVDRLTEKHKAYITLLFCANISYTKHFEKELTGTFEKISLDVLVSMFPKSAEFRVFGSGSFNRTGRNTSFWNKLIDLEGFMCGKINAEEADISKQNTGDGGVDIIGRIRLEDNSSHFPVFFAQCACSPNEWQVKQYSTSAEQWKNYIHLPVFPYRFIFIPQSFRKSDGAWHSKNDLRDNVIFDRVRILKMLNKYTTFSNFLAKSDIKKIIKTKESAF